MADVACKVCKGHGTQNCTTGPHTFHTVECSECQGIGLVDDGIVPHVTVRGSIHACTTCQGTGKRYPGFSDAPHALCLACGGVGSFHNSDVMGMRCDDSETGFRALPITNVGDDVARHPIERLGDNVSGKLPLIGISQTPELDRASDTDFVSEKADRNSTVGNTVAEASHTWGPFKFTDQERVRIMALLNGLVAQALGSSYNDFSKSAVLNAIERELKDIEQYE